MRIEEIEKRQQEMQEKISQVKKMVTNLTKRKGITDDPNLQVGPTLRKDGIDPSIVPNLNDLCELEKLKKDLSNGHNTSMCNRSAISWTRS